MTKEPFHLGTTVIKIGGSTLGEHDTTLQDLATLQKEGANPVVVHGGGKIISEWMKKQGLRATFKDGLRVTDEASLKIVVAVLSGLINKELVGALNQLGARAVGFCGADAGMLQAEVKILTWATLAPSPTLTRRLSRQSFPQVVYLLSRPWQFPSTMIPNLQVPS